MDGPDERCEFHSRRTTQISSIFMEFPHAYHRPGRSLAMSILDAQDADTWRSGVSFSMRNRIYRLCWGVAWRLLISWTPPQLHAWRRFVLRAFGAKISATARVYGSARIWSPANLEVGAHACIGPNSNVYSMAKITLGDFALVSQGAFLCAGSHDIDDPFFQLTSAPITIDEKAWVAAEAFVGPGVNIQQGAVLGARACAFRDLMPWRVYVGNPAVMVKERRVRPAVDEGGASISGSSSANSH